MKNVKALVLIKGFFLVFFVSILFTVSCTSDSNSLPEVQTTISSSLRVALNNMLSKFIPAAKLAVSSNDDTTDDGAPELCFDFVYPITLSYNTGETVIVNSLDEIIELLQLETNDVFLNGIAFPFQVEYFAQNLIITVENENGFEALNISCDEYYGDDFDYNSCYEFQFPISLINADNQVFEVSNLNSLYDLLSNQTNAPIVNFVYPFNLIYNNEVVVIQNIYQFVEIEESCYEYEYPNPGDDDTIVDCNCTTDVNPVCVIDEAGQLHVFTNACFANCDGFYESDFVTCE
jgi:hypothetical protein